MPKNDKVKCRQVEAFIKRHEWLGKMPTRPTHRFTAKYKGHLAGVIVMATPNSFSNLLGKDNRDLEKLISRGACISWSPKNLGSALVMFSVRWMVKNTSFRLFTAYSDIEARELGTIYQACNFIYLGQNSGARAEYFDPLHPERSWFSDRLFRKHSQTRRYAKELDIEWNQDWSTHDKTHWNKIPFEVARAFKNQAVVHKSRCQMRRLPLKHKYAYVLGRTKSETNHLKKQFFERSPNLKNIPYPKNRGPLIDTAANLITNKEEILTTPSIPSRPQVEVNDSIFLTVKEAAMLLNTSIWSIYKTIESDPLFPAHNIGVKKKLVINKTELIPWMESRSKRRRQERQNLPTGIDLLKLGEI